MGNGNSSVSPTLLEEKHVVIIGGGYGGIALASTLQKNQIPFTLVDPKDCFHHNVAACRAGVFPGRYKNSSKFLYLFCFELYFRYLGHLEFPNIFGLGLSLCHLERNATTYNFSSNGNFVDCNCLYHAHENKCFDQNFLPSS